MSLAGHLVPPYIRREPDTNVTDQGGPHIEDYFCNTGDYSHDLVVSLLCAMYLVFALVYTFFGYRCFKAIMFLTGFTFGGALVYLICLQEYLMPMYGNVCVSICAGVLFGLITMLIQYVGLFMTGFHTGLFCAVAGLATYDHLMIKPPSTLWLCVAVLLGSSIHFAVLNLYWKKALTIFGSSIYGGAAVAVCLDYFFEKFAMVKWMWDRAKLESPEPFPCQMSGLLLIVWPLFTLAGLFVQCAITGQGTYHEPSLSARKRRLKSQQRPTKEQRDEMKQRKYRYLYQVRTAHGDVISQAYIQALQQCKNVNRESSTLQSDSTHLTILPGCEQNPTTQSLDSDEDLTMCRRQRN